MQGIISSIKNFKGTKIYVKIKYGDKVKVMFIQKEEPIVAFDYLPIVLRESTYYAIVNLRIEALMIKFDMTKGGGSSIIIHAVYEANSPTEKTRIEKVLSQYGFKGGEDE